MIKWITGKNLMIIMIFILTNVRGMCSVRNKIIKIKNSYYVQESNMITCAILRIIITFMKLPTNIWRYR